MPQAIPFTTLKIPGLLAAHNELAQTRGVSPLKKWHDTRCKLAERVALLRTQKPLFVLPTPANDNTPQPESPEPQESKKRKQPNRDVMLSVLAVITHYEHAITGNYISKRATRRFSKRMLLSVGLSYNDVILRVRKACPASKITGNDVRWTVKQIRDRASGFNCTLPDKRPHSTKGKAQCKLSQRKTRTRKRSA